MAREVAEAVEGEGWSVAWALEDALERPPPSSLVARCDTAEALALARAATKRKRNARLASAVSLRGTREKRRAPDKNEKAAAAAVHGQPGGGGEFWRRLSRGHAQGAVSAASSDPAATDVQPQVVVAA